MKRIDALLEVAAQMPNIRATERLSGVIGMAEALGKIEERDGTDD
jgi:hypothetical protein